MKEEKLSLLLNKYYDGNTSPEEEQELKNYFSGNLVFPGYEAEKEIFCHYYRSEKIPVPSGDFEMRIMQAVNDIENNRKNNIFRKRYITMLSAAATILIMIGTYFIFFQKREPADSFSDPRIAYAETMKILNDVSVKLNKGTMALQPISKISTTARAGMRSVDRSVSVITDNLRRIGLTGQSEETENRSKKENNK